jgi:hypothetical protein
MEEVDRKQTGLFRAFVAVAAILWLLFFALERFPIGAPNLAFGLGCALAAALWGWAAFIFYRARGLRPALVAPVFLLASSALWFYVVLPSASIRFTRYAWWTNVRGDSGHEGEWLILRFSLVLIATAVWVAFHAAPANRNNAAVHACFGRVPYLVLGLAAGGIFALRAHAGIDLAAVLPGEYARQIYFACPVIASLSIAVATLRILDGEPGATLDFALLAAILFVLLFTGAFKAIFFVMGAAILALTVIMRSSKLLAGFLAFMVLMVVAITYGRYSSAPASQGPRQAIIGTFEGKAVLRQRETVDCLTGIVRRHRDDADVKAWLGSVATGLTPRFLWPGKPDLSSMGRKVLDYCAIVKGYDPSHSASATMLGEPLIVGGWSALMVAQMILVVVLGGVSLVWISGGPLGSAMALGLVPWLIDFDQHYFLYIANLVKAGLVSGAVLFSMSWGRRIIR